MKIMIIDNHILFREGVVSLMRLILARRPETAFVMLSSMESDGRLFEMIANGARGYLPKNIKRPVLLAALRALGRGEAVIPRNLVSKILGEFTRLSKLTLDDKTVKDSGLLTYRELEVLKKLVTRATNREIANQLAISENTVRVHVSRILEKLNLRNRREASEFARRIKWVDPLPL